MTQPSGKNKKQYLAVIGVLSVVFVLLSLGVHLAHSVYDGRIFFDHDWYFTETFHDFLNAPPHGFGKFADWLRIDLPGGTYYPLINLGLGLISSIKPINLFMYRSFNLLFLALLMFGAYRLGALLADRRAGLLCAVALAALPVIDDASRSFNPHFHAAAFMLLACAFTVRVMQKPELRLAYPAIGVLCGLAVMTHPISLMQSSLVFGFLFLLAVSRKNLRGNALRFVTALACFLLVAQPFLRALPGYSREKSLFLLNPATSAPLLAAMAKDWLIDISFGFFGPWFLFVFGLFLVVGLHHVFAAKDRRLDDLFLMISLLFNASLSLVTRFSGGFTNDFLLFACLAAVLLPAIAWRELQRLPRWRKFVPLMILLLFMAASMQKSAALTTYPSGDSLEYRARFLPSRGRLVSEPGWLLRTMDELRRRPPVKNVRVRLNPRTEPPMSEDELDGLSRRTRQHVLAVKQFLGWNKKIKPSGAVLLTLETKDTPWTAREAAQWLREQLGEDPAAYAQAVWFAKNGDMLTFGLDQHYLLELMRWTR
ncbi:MAG TPA: glycosyltransferase family 39 protein [bacterium]|nr:glycosyltransferase family 39 protein [bacterium]